MTRIIEDIKFDFQDVLLMPKRSELESRSQVSLERTYKFKHAQVQYTGIPIVVANMDHTGTIAMADALAPFHMSVALHKFHEAQTLVHYFHIAANPHTFYSMGITDDDFNRFELVMAGGSADKGNPVYVCIDVANGYSRKFVNYVEKVRDKYPNIVIMAGNVVTPDMTYDLLERGADIVKIGIGPGSVCTTRKITGVGYPQLSAIMECADAAHGAGGLICGDGGITSPGDVAKAFAAGADFVMCGGLFAGHKECGGDAPRGPVRGSILQQLNQRTSQFHQDPSRNRCFITLPSGRDHIVDLSVFITAHSQEAAIDKILDGLPAECFEEVPRATMKFYGMSSKEAMDAHYGGKANYRASEGKAVEIPYKGPVSNTVEEILGGLRSACTYTGAKTLKQLPKCATFVKVGRQLNTVFGEE